MKKDINNPESKKELISVLENQGFPLERKTKKKLIKLGYVNTKTYYYESEVLEKESNIVQNRMMPGISILSKRVNRELDLYGSKLLEKTITVKNTILQFIIHVVCECKTSKENDFFAFVDSKRETNFPITLNGDLVIKDKLNLTNFPVTTDRIVEINRYKPVKKVEISTSYNAAEQIIPALKSIIAEIEKNLNNKYNELEKRSIRNKIAQGHKDNVFEKDERDYESKIKPESIKKFFRGYTYSELGEGIDRFDIELVIPLIVLSSDNKLIKIKTNDEEFIEEFEEIPWCLYYHVPKESQEFRENEKVDFKPIAVCNLENLDICLNQIEKELLTNIDKASTDIQKDPHRILDELVLSKIKHF